MNELIAGATAMASLVAALFFLRYWKETRDRFFAFFALAFLVFALSRAGLAFIDEATEGRTFLYLIRLLAFVLILIAIIDKNRTRGTGRN